jgi:D-3-phosphoglycerate dehydrogenase
MSGNGKLVVQVGPRATTFWQEERELLEPLGAELVAAVCDDQNALIEATREADVITAWAYSPIRKPAIEALQHCRGIVRYGIGVDSIDIDIAAEHGIPVVNIPDYCIEEVSNQAFVHLLALAKKFPLLHNNLRAGRWDQSVFKPMPSIYDQTLGLVGFGRIGRAVAKKAQAFGMKFVVADPFVSEEVVEQAGGRRVSLDELLAESDFVSVHVPLMAETRHLFSEREFKMMKPSAYIINTSRGSVIDEAALIHALQEREIAGAGLDVFEKEPPAPDNALLKMDNVTVTPHAADYSDRSRAYLRWRVGKAASELLQGVWPENVVNPKSREKYRWTIKEEAHA